MLFDGVLALSATRMIHIVRGSACLLRTCFFCVCTCKDYPEGWVAALCVVFDLGGGCVHTEPMEYARYAITPRTMKHALSKYEVLRICYFC